MQDWNPSIVSSEQSFYGYASQCAARVDAALALHLPNSATLPSRLHQAMSYAVLDGGKRVRPLLVYASAAALGHDHESLDLPACAVEMIHAYSLVHDDLPDMDDDELRRGKPTVHVAYDPATAILAGDALQALAFQLLADFAAQSPTHASQMVSILAKAAGSRGMCGGQAMDMDAIGKSMTLPELESMHIHKTGALIRAAVQLGALAANASAEQTGHLNHYANCIGLAFQIQDDILDVEGNTETLGKTQGKDQAQDKPTYTSLLGLAEARERCQDLYQQSLAALKPFGEPANALRDVARFIVMRDR